MAMPPEERSVGELFSDVLSQLTALVRKEIQLARAEMAAKANQAATGIGMLVIALAVVIAALVLLLMALAAGLVALGVGPTLANLLSGIVGLLIAGALAYTGVQRLKPANLAPNRTITELQRDAAAAKESVR